MFNRIKRRVINTVSYLPGVSELDFKIESEIEKDDFWQKLAEYSARPEVKAILEIGSSSGEGSTSALVQGSLSNPSKPDIYCIEASKKRFQSLKELYKSRDNVNCLNAGSTSTYLSEKEIVDAFHLPPKAAKLNKLLSWRKDEQLYLEREQLEQNGIDKIKSDFNIALFDLVLIDGSEFTGASDLEKVYGAKFIFLDDILSLKNFSNHQKLKSDTNYALVYANETQRNGFSLFQKVVWSKQNCIEFL